MSKQLIGDDTGTLSGLLYSLRRVGCVSAVLLGLWFIIYGVREPLGALIGLVLLSLVATSLLTRLPSSTLRMLTEISNFAISVVVTLVAGVALGGALSMLFSILDLLVGNVGNAAKKALSAYLLLWPLAMIVSVIVNPATMGSNWLFPHVQLARMTREWLRNAKILAAIQVVVTPVRSLIFVGSIVLFLVASRDMPGLNSKTEETVDGILGIAAFITIIAILRSTKSKKGEASITSEADWRKLREKVAKGEIDNAGLLRLLDTTNDTSRLLQMLATAEPGLMLKAVQALTDLDRALEFVKQVVPADTTTRIPPTLWKFAPDFTLADFSNWLIDYDKRNPGRLPTLASSKRGLLAQAVRRAQEQANQ